MKRLIKILDLDLEEFKKIALIEKGANIDSFDKTYAMPPARDKHSHIKSLITLPYFLIYSFFAHAFISQAVKWRFPTSPEQ